MKKGLIISLLGMLGVASQSVTAGSIKCQGHLFEDDQTNKNSIHQYAYSSNVK